MVFSLSARQAWTRAGAIRAYAAGRLPPVSQALWARMTAANPDATARRDGSGAALRAVLDGRHRQPPLRLAMVYPFAPHNYELRYWLAAAGIDPERDLRIVVAAPPTMVDLLRAGSIDGFCVGEPWATCAVQLGCGKVVVSKYDIWNNSPEKVLAVTADWHAHNPHPHAALIRALIEAGRWLDQPENRLEAAHVIAGESFVDSPVQVLRCSLLGHFDDAGRDEESGRDFHAFFRYAANFPWRSHALWMLGQMWRWGHIERPCDLPAIAERVYLPDFYRAAAAPLDIAVPRRDAKPEGIHDSTWTLDDATHPLPMGPDLFIDRREFHPERWRQYLREQEIGSPRVPLAALSD